LAHYRSVLRDMQARMREGLNRSIQVIEEDARPPGEHERFASEAIEKEIEVEKTEEQLLRDISTALQKIADGTYGTCEACSAPIPEERLKAIPHARFCAPCQRQAERSPRSFES
jgi:RNA polymerase-binding protein DksA